MIIKCVCEWCQKTKKKCEHIHVKYTHTDRERERDTHTYPQGMRTPGVGTPGVGTPGWGPSLWFQVGLKFTQRCGNPSVAVQGSNISYHRLQHCTQSDTWKAVGSCWKAVGSCWKSVWRSVITNRSATQATPTPMNWTTSMLGWSNSRLSDQNRTRSCFLNDLNILTIDTFLVFNLAALACRRDIAMPGLIHRTVLGTGPNHFYSWIEVDNNPPRLSQRLNPTQGRRIVERPDLIRLEIGQ